MISETGFKILALYCVYHSFCGGLNCIVTSVSTWAFGSPTSVQTKYLLSSISAPVAGVLFGVTLWFAAASLARKIAIRNDS